MLYVPASPLTGVTAVVSFLVSLLPPSNPYQSNHFKTYRLKTYIRLSCPLLRISLKVKARNPSPLGTACPVPTASISLPCSTCSRHTKLVVMPPTCRAGCSLRPVPQKPLRSHVAHSQTSFRSRTQTSHGHFRGSLGRSTK